jgi:uncharacterized damage-inducible protein DinB
MNARYPIGEFQWAGKSDDAARAAAVGDIEAAPALLREAVAGLPADQLDTPYRGGGWTVRQVVHHVADSHMNSYIRFRLAITEADPVIKPYDERRWAELPDARFGAVETSLALLEGLHARWVTLLRSFGAEEWAKTFRHPERGRVSLDEALALYSWHGKHHVAQIESLRNRKGWSVR